MGSHLEPVEGVKHEEVAPWLGVKVSVRVRVRARVRMRVRVRITLLPAPPDALLLEVSRDGGGARVVRLQVAAAERPPPAHLDLLVDEAPARNAGRREGAGPG